MNLQKLSKHRQPQVGEQVYQTVLNLIIEGDISAGEFIPISSLSEALNVSNTPIREALSKLKNDGIIIKIPYKGYKVREFDKGSIKEIYECRAIIEGYACKLTAEKVGNDTIINLIDLQHKGESLLARGDLENYRIYNENLHKMIINKSQNNQLIKMFNNIDKIVRVLASATINISGRPQKAIKEHKNIIDAIKNRNSNKARKIMEDHILSVLKDL